jgi:hypothetical protein
MPRTKRSSLPSLILAVLLLVVAGAGVVLQVVQNSTRPLALLPEMAAVRDSNPPNKTPSLTVPHGNMVDTSQDKPTPLQRAQALLECYRDPTTPTAEGVDPVEGKFKAWDCPGGLPVDFEQVESGLGDTVLMAHSDKLTCEELEWLMKNEKQVNCVVEYDPQFTLHVTAERFLQEQERKKNPK